MTNTIMLIHGAWLNSRCWDGFKARYEARGYTVVAPNWPYNDRSPSELRERPHPELANTGIAEILDHLEARVRALSEPPILIGHSAGGVFVMNLLDRGLGAAGVAIDPAPTQGVPLGRHALVSAAPVLFSWGSWRRSMQMSRRFFARRFAQTVPADQVDRLYDRYIVPTAGKVYWDGIRSPAGRIRWNNPARPPLLLIGGGIDLIADASMTRAIYRRQSRAPSRTELRIFDDRSHWTCLEPGWEEVADYALGWGLENAHSAPKVSSISAGSAA